MKVSERDRTAAFAVMQAWAGAEGSSVQDDVAALAKAIAQARAEGEMAGLERAVGVAESHMDAAQSAAEGDDLARREWLARGHQSECIRNKIRTLARGDS